jgi:membrane-associated phospholipid phosphatase
VSEAAKVDEGRKAKAKREGVDLGFVGREVGRVVLLLVALIPCVVAWGLTKPYAVLLAVPLLLSFFMDRDEFPVWAAQSLIFLLFVGLRLFADQTGVPWQTDYVVIADRLIGLGRNPTAALQSWIHSRTVDVIACWTYVSFFIVPSFVAIALWWRRRGLREFIASIIVIDVISLVVLFALPTVPPWMATAGGAIEPIRRIFSEVMQPLAPQIFEAGYRASANDVAAMPSVHMAITVLAALGLGRFGKAWSAAGWAYAALMLFAIVYLGEHWVIDGIAGLVVAVFAWRIAPRVAPRIFPRVRSGTAA